MTFRLRDLFALVHSGPKLVDLGERDFRDGQAFAGLGINEVHIPKLEAGNRLRAHIVEVLIEIVGSTSHIEEGKTAQFFARRGGIAGQRHLMDARTIGQFSEVQILLDAGEYEIAGAINGAVAAGAGVGKGDNPFDLRSQSRKERHTLDLG